MAQIIVKDRVVNASLMSIIRKIRQDSGYTYFKDVQDKGDYIRVTCPFHKNGQEQHPSMSIFLNDSNSTYQSGNYNCLTCGASGSLPKLVSYCLDMSNDKAKEWLIDNFSSEILIESSATDKLISDIEKEYNSLFETKSNKYIDESILKEYNYYHPYMWKRKLSKEVVDKFKIGYDEELKAITFPVWDERNNLVMITKRCVENKKFFIPSDVSKPVYLLNFAIKENIDKVYVCESQINTLYCYTLGMPAIGLFGTGDTYQYDILKKAGIKHYVLALDGDVAGRKGIYKFIKALGKKSFIEVMVLPEGKDINDLTKEEIDKLPIYDSSEWLEKYTKQN